MPELGLDREHDPALGGAVELGEHHARHVDGLGELAGLREPVLTGRRVDDEQHLLERSGRAVDDAAELLQLLHQVDLRVQPAGGVDEHEVGVAALRRAHRVEHDRARDPRPPDPARGRRRPARPTCASCSAAAARNVSAAASTTVRPSPVSRCASLAIVVVLPTPLTPDEHPDVRLARRDTRASRSPTSSTDASSGAQHRRDAVDRRDLLGGHARLHVVEDPGRGRHADVGEDQRLLELVPGVVVDAAAAAQRPEGARERGAGLAEAVAEPGLDPFGAAPARPPRRPRAGPRRRAGASTSGGAVGGGSSGQRLREQRQLLLGDPELAGDLLGAAAGPPRRADAQADEREARGRR